MSVLSKCFTLQTSCKCEKTSRSTSGSSAGNPVGPSAISPPGVALLAQPAYLDGKTVRQLHLRFASVLRPELQTVDDMTRSTAGNASKWIGRRQRFWRRER